MIYCFYLRELFGECQNKCKIYNNEKTIYDYVIIL